MKNLITEKRTPLYSIFISQEDINNMESQAFYAAKELRYYLDRITAASFQIEAAENIEKCGIYIGKCSNLDTSDLDTDGFKIESYEKHILINGNIRGVIYGTYEFLEQLGCRFFTPTCEKIPTCEKLEIPELHICQKPILEYREHNYSDATQNLKFAVKCHFNGGSHRIPEHMGGYMPYA